jgi:hypothetical protein
VGIRAKRGIIEAVERLRVAHGVAGDVQMWTLTVDPKRYESPEAAWRDVGEHRRISEAMRTMGLRYWAWVLEWHESGWPHWHVLVWEPVSPGKRMYIDHAAMTRAWGIGHTNYKPSRGRSIRHAASYVCKYLTKPKGQMPSWVAGLANVTMVRGSRALGALLGDGPMNSQDEAATSDGASRPCDARPNAVAVAACCASVRVVRECVSSVGVVFNQFVGRVELPVRIVQRLAARVLEGTAEVRGSAVRLAECDSGWLRLRRSLRLVE